VQTMDVILQTVSALAERPMGASLSDLADVARAAVLTDDEIDEVVRSDSSKPYGRRVLLNTRVVEGMIARWTRGVPCAPHDHGGSYGAVRILQGSALHTVWKVVDGALVKMHEGMVHAGDVLTCGPEMVHSMVDGGAEQPLTTLHLYVDPIDHMFVYDLNGGSTYVVDGGCGAWLPLDEPRLIRSVHAGFRRPAELLSA
jgi:cysteine dioxygenase